MNKEFVNSLSRSGLFRYLKDADYDRAWKELNMNTSLYHHKQIIYCQEDVMTKMSIIHKGSVHGERLQFDGESNLAYVYTRGELFGFEGAFSGRKTSPLQYTAQGETTIISFDAKNVFNSVYVEQLMKGLMELMANDDIRKLYRIEILTIKSLRKRILTYLNILSSRYGSDSFQTGMSQEQMAQYLSVNRSALSSELNQMKKEGVIDFQKDLFVLHRHITK